MLLNTFFLTTTNPRVRGMAALFALGTHKNALCTRLCGAGVTPPVTSILLDILSYIAGTRPQQRSVTKDIFCQPSTTSWGSTASSPPLEKC